VLVTCRSNQCWTMSLSFLLSWFAALSAFSVPFAGPSAFFKPASDAALSLLKRAWSMVTVRLIALSAGGSGVLKPGLPKITNILNVDFSTFLFVAVIVFGLQVTPALSASNQSQRSLLTETDMKSDSFGQEELPRQMGLFTCQDYPGQCLVVIAMALACCISFLVFAICFRYTIHRSPFSGPLRSVLVAVHVLRCCNPREVFVHDMYYEQGRDTLLFAVASLSSGEVHVDLD